MLAASIAAALSGCRDSAPPAAAPATVDHPVKEAELTRVTLSEEAEARIRIATDSVRRRTVRPMHTLVGEIMTPPGHTLNLTAPVAGAVAAPDAGVIPLPGSSVRRGEPLLRLVPLPPDRDLLRGEEEVTLAEVRERQAGLEAARLEDLMRDSLVSRRDYERAQAELAAARTALEAARGRLEVQRTGVPGTGVGVSPLTIASPSDGVVLALETGAGQVVGAGQPLITVARLDRLWVRAPIFAGEVARVDPKAAAQVDPLQGDSGSTPIAARRVVAPPSADPVSSSVDLYYELSRGAGLRPGQRVSVSVPLTGAGREGAVVPFSAVLYDMNGGAWVYVKTGPHQYERQRVQVAGVIEGFAVLATGPAPGAEVVVQGAAELFGTEFGAGK